MPTKNPTFTLLGGQLTLANTPPRPTEDALWLAAAVPATHGNYLEFGTGSGAAALAFLTRVPKAAVQGVELEKDLTTLATHNAHLNHLTGRFNVLTGDAQTLHLNKKFQHSFANPPFHNVAAGFYSTSKQMAHGISPQSLSAWVENMKSHTEDGGTCTIIIHADMVNNLPPPQLLIFLKSHESHPAKRAILQWRIGAEPTPSKTITIETYNKPLRKKVLESAEALL